MASDEEAAPERWADYKYKADALLKTMESSFLEIIVEHTAMTSALPPKGGNPADDGSSMDGDVGGERCERHGAKIAGIVVEMCEAEANALLTDLVRWRMLGDLDSMRSALGYTEALIVQIIREGIQHYGWDEKGKS